MASEQWDRALRQTEAADAELLHMKDVLRMRNVRIAEHFRVSRVAIGQRIGRARRRQKAREAKP